MELCLNFVWNFALFNKYYQINYGSHLNKKTRLKRRLGQIKLDQLLPIRTESTDSATEFMDTLLINSKKGKQK